MSLSIESQSAITYISEVLRIKNPKDIISFCKRKLQDLDSSSFNSESKLDVYRGIINALQ
jgi:hypothetical protein